VPVREVQPIQLRCGASYDTERGLGPIFDVSAHNMLAKARVIGWRSPYDGQIREARADMSQPSLRHWPIDTTGSIYWREERNPQTELSGQFDLSRRARRFSRTTLRGFAQNAAGPIGPDGLPTGGAAILVINNERRFPCRRRAPRPYPMVPGSRRLRTVARPARR
jgi:hypothetical protein